MNNGLSEAYFNAAKDGKDIKTPAVEFWRFHHYMSSNGTFYEPCGTSPQDGEHKAVLKVLEIATAVVKSQIGERGYDEDEGEQ